MTPSKKSAVYKPLEMRYNIRTFRPSRSFDRPGPQAGYLVAVFLKKLIELFGRDNFNQLAVDCAYVAIGRVALFQGSTSFLSSHRCQL